MSFFILQDVAGEFITLHKLEDDDEYDEDSTSIESKKKRQRVSEQVSDLHKSINKIH